MNRNPGAWARIAAVARGQNGAAAIPPGPLEHLWQHEHRHVAAHAVALARDALQLVEQRFLQRGIAVVELQGIGPAGEVRIASVGENAVSHAPVVVRLRRKLL